MNGVFGFRIILQEVLVLLEAIPKFFGEIKSNFPILFSPPQACLPHEPSLLSPFLRRLPLFPKRRQLLDIAEP